MRKLRAVQVSMQIEFHLIGGFENFTKLKWNSGFWVQSKLCNSEEIRIFEENEIRMSKFYKQMGAKSMRIRLSSKASLKQFETRKPSKMQKWKKRQGQIWKWRISRTRVKHSENGIYCWIQTYSLTITLPIDTHALCEQNQWSAKKANEMTNLCRQNDAIWLIEVVNNN